MYGVSGTTDALRPKTASKRRFISGGTDKNNSDTIDVNVITRNTPSKVVTPYFVERDGLSWCSTNSGQKS